MAAQTQPNYAAIDPVAFWANMAQASQYCQRLAHLSVTRSMAQGISTDDPLNLSETFSALGQSLLSNPAHIAAAQAELWSDAVKLWHHAAMRLTGSDDHPAPFEADRGDRRFKHASWQDELVFSLVKQSYLLIARWLQATVDDLEDLDGKHGHKASFYTRQFVDAMSPTNFAGTNPEVVRATIESNGENLVRGLANLLDDMENSDGQLRTKIIHDHAFEVGKDLAATPGQVIHRNELMELIQYEPTTEKVNRRPLLVTPPWINKYYILDLRPENSFVNWARSQGHTVFIISWANPGADLAHKGFDDYLKEGTLEAMDVIEKVTGEREINLVGLCLGGIVQATALAYLADKGDDRVKSATFMATNLDFSEPGDLGVFLEEKQVEQLEKQMADTGGYLDASAMATTFNMLRSNDLIWSFVVNNYLLGKDPAPFDLLYWNADSTHMPGKMHSFYLRNICLENRLVKPGALEIAGVALDLGKVKTPVYIAGTKEDHIAPWKSAYKATKLYGGPVRFVLGGSGHIAGVTNAPPNAKYGHWSNKKLADTADEWLDAAQHQDESWWVDWDKWVRRHGGGKVGARSATEGKTKPLAPAPGTYVMQQA